MRDDPKAQSLVEARAALAAARTGTLSVIDLETGGPFGAFVNVAVDGSCVPLLLLSRLSRHVKALDANPAASLMVTGAMPREGDPLTGLRVTVTGQMERIDDDEAAALYLASHPYAELYAGFGDFSYWRLAPAKAFVVAGFGRIYSFGADEFFSS